MSAKFSRIPARATTAKLSAIDWSVLHVIALHADNDGRAFPSMARIATMTGIKRANVPRSIARLEQRGLLDRTRLRHGHGWQVSHYRIRYEPPTDEDVLVTEDTSASGVINAEDTSGSSVLDGEDTLAPGVSSKCDRGVLSNDAVTDHRTDSYQERESERLRVKGAPVLSGEDTGQGGSLCSCYVITNATGFRLCGRPVVVGADRCAEHIARLAATAPDDTHPS